MVRLNQEGINEAKRILMAMGAEIKMDRFGESNAIFLKPLNAEQGKLILSYVQHLEDHSFRNDEAMRMSSKLGVAESFLDQIKNSPEQTAKGLASKGISELSKM